MREILFRGKRVDNGEWAESPYPYGTMSGGVVQHDFISQTVGQYTGLTDKNGAKIFEGDILRNSLDSFTAIVKWGFPHTGFVLKMKGTVYAFTRMGSEIYEVIGNIYDNPELIKDDTK